MEVAISIIPFSGFLACWPERAGLRTTTLPLPASRKNEAGPFLPRSGTNHLKKGARDQGCPSWFFQTPAAGSLPVWAVEKPYVTSEVLRALQVNNQFVNLRLPSESEWLERPLLC